MFAFKTHGSVRFFNYGEVSEGGAGDWVITAEDGDVFVMSDVDFGKQ